VANAKNKLGAMKSHDSLYRWSFCLADEPPGPSVGDAAEHVEGLGFDPWALSSLHLSRETLIAGEYFAEFDLVGTRDLIEALRRAHDRATGWASASPAHAEKRPSPRDDSESS
jgi:hypothetical protein